MHDVCVHMAVAQRTVDTLSHVWLTQTVPLQLKLRIYKAGVRSRLTYGSEACHLIAQLQKTRNGCNNRMLSHVTGRTVYEEAIKETRTYDIIRSDDQGLETSSGCTQRGWYWYAYTRQCNTYMYGNRR